MKVLNLVDREVGRGVTSESMLARGRLSLAGGDSSNMRVLPYALPLVAEEGQGCRIKDVEGREYIDLNMAYGPLLFGHRAPKIIEAVLRQLTERGSQLGFPTEISIRVAEKVKRLFPSMELTRFANSGTEAVASAVRLARAYTGRKKLVVFEGNYHGWSEAVFHRYHAPLSELPEQGFAPALPGTLGMDGGIEDVLVLRANNPEVLQRCMEIHGHEVAGIIAEPVMGNAGVIPPEPGFLNVLRRTASEHGALLIFDEVITGLRVGPGGGQEHYGVRPDITVLSKALAGGFPVAAFGASSDIMDLIVKGKLFHGGVYSGNALVMSAADAVLDEVLAKGPAIYGYLHQLSKTFADGMNDIFTRLGIPHLVQYVGPMLSLFLTRRPVDKLTEYRQVRAECDFERYIDFQHHLQRSGVFFHPNQFEPMFLSTTHRPADIGLVLERMETGARQCFE